MSVEDFIVGDGADVPAGTHPAKLTGLRIAESDQYGDFRVWEFLTDAGKPIDASSSLKTGPKSKGFRWATNLLGRQPVKGERLQLIGLPCTLVVVDTPDGWPKVTEVLPAMQPVQAPAPAPTALPNQVADGAIAVGPTGAPKVANVDDLPF